MSAAIATATRNHASSQKARPAAMPKATAKEAKKSAPVHLEPGPNDVKIKVPLSQLTRWKGNPRKERDQDHIASIANSIEENGLIHPLRVFSPTPAEPYAVYIGDTRLSSHQLLVERGTINPDHLVDCVFDEIDETTALKRATAENIARKNFTPIEQAEAIEALAEQHLTSNEIAKAVGLTRVEVAAALKVARLDETAKNLVRTKDRPYNWAISLSDAAKHLQERILNDIAQNAQAWTSVEQIKAEIRKNRIPAAFALFDVEASGLATATDLLDPEVWIIDVEGFWAHQKEAIKQLVSSLEQQGHYEVVELKPAELHNPQAWYTDPTNPMRRAFIEVSPSGQVEVFADLMPIVDESFVEEPVAAPDESFFNADIAEATTEDRGESPTIRPPKKAAAAAFLADKIGEMTVEKLEEDSVLALQVLLTALIENNDIRSAGELQKVNRQIVLTNDLKDEFVITNGKAFPKLDLPSDLASLARELARAVPALLPVFKTKRKPFDPTLGETIAQRMAAPTALELRARWTPGEEFFSLLTLPELRSLAFELFEDDSNVNPAAMDTAQLVTFLSIAFAEARDGTFVFSAEKAAELNAWAPNYLIRDAI